MTAMQEGKKPYMRHGGDVYSLEVDLDFSVNTNPCADRLFKEAFDKEGILDKRDAEAAAKICEAGLKGLKTAVRYPDLQTRKLRAAIAEMEGTDPEKILCGNGASELFMAVAHAVKPKKALVLSPCYSGYAHVLSAVGCEVKEHFLKEENGFVPDETLLADLTEEIDLFFLALPNNPTGKLAGKDLLRQILARCGKAHILPVIDACFYPLASEEPLETENAVVVKAFTKMMSMPGLRLGYLMADDRALSEAIGKQLPEWNVSTVASEIGIAAAQILSETDFMHRSLDYIKKERDYLAGELRSSGFQVFDSDTNYLLTKGDPGIYEKLLAKKILVRDCTSFEGLGPEYLRFAIRPHEENEALIAALKTL